MEAISEALALGRAWRRRFFLYFLGMPRFGYSGLIRSVMLAFFLRVLDTVLDLGWEWRDEMVGRRWDVFVRGGSAEMRVVLGIGEVERMWYG